MWTITGPFDTEVGADLSLQKTKLLKTGKSYLLGRKERSLCVGSKKVSHDHSEFIVGEYSLDDVHNPEKRPKLEFVNKRDKAMRLLRGDAQADAQSVANPNTSTELRDGDVVSIVTGIPLAVKWLPICCYSPNLRGKSNISLETCSSLGISIVYTPNSRVTHHIIPTYVANAPIAASLISAAQFVKLEWLTDILKNLDSLEESFVLPPISKHRPTFSPSLSPSQKVFKVWEPNEERLNIFAEYRFLVLGEKIREVESDLRELIKRGGGFLDTFDVAGGVAKLHKALARGQAKDGQQLVVVADAKDMRAAVGQDEWKKLVAEVKSFDLHITHPNLVIQAVVEVETSLLTTPQADYVDADIQDSDISSSALPNCVPNSIPDEPSVTPEEPAAPRKRLLRRAVSRPPSVEPTSEPLREPKLQTESPKPRNLLSRRAQSNAAADSSNTAEQPSEPTPLTNRPRLKRRLGAAPATPEASSHTAGSQLPDLVSNTMSEPPLKKFKALFEASDPSKIGVNPSDDILLASGIDVTQTQSQTQGFIRRPAAGSSLGALREEEEESQIPGQEIQLRGTKRTLELIDEDTEMGEVEECVQPASKRQAVENVHSNQGTTVAETAQRHKPASNKKKEKNTGALVGQPDTDVDFLKAVASTKKGKRAEDVFDREFNNLKISKPEIQRQEPEEEWRLISDFGDDTGLRGNFMVVLEMDIPRKSGSQNSIKLDLPLEWADKPNFKKFKKKLQGTQRILIELVSQGNDGDTGPSRWKTRKPQSQRIMSQSLTEIRSESQPLSLKPKSSIIKDDDENEAPRLGGTRSTQSVAGSSSRSASRIPSTAASKPPSRVGSRSSKRPLFLDSDDDIQEIGNPAEDDHKGVDEDDEVQTLRSNSVSKNIDTVGRQRRTASGREIQAPRIADDDSDDGAVFKGFGGRRKAR